LALGYFAQKATGFHAIGSPIERLLGCEASPFEILFIEENMRLTHELPLLPP
jgi:hypothetical protein